mmetsp:Transcript_19669/g.42904  ORF Transcript_19669/g.42904 Transcript_19669/m.42904 type:complete len:423 (+) Transcript_19669:246-1514(+)
MGNLISHQDSGIWNDGRFFRAVQAAAAPFEGREIDRSNVEGRAVSEALVGLASIVGRAPPGDRVAHQSIVNSVAQLVQRGDAMANELDLKDAVELRWAARTLLARLPGLIAVCAGGPDADDASHSEHDSDDALAACLSCLDTRVSHLPFDIVPLGLDWSDIIDISGHEDQYCGYNEPLEQAELVSLLRDAIPFNFDTIVTRTGSAVVERRGTAWVAEDDIGALAYSGKLMVPHRLPGVVRSAMRATERVVLRGADDPNFFDCALCNHYPDAETACKFHTDPEHGTLWDRLTCVVSAGSDRRFAFRPIPGASAWDDWDTGKKGAAVDKNIPAVYHMFAGDIVKMYGRCNDEFYHAVYADDAINMKVNGQGRVSLVLKRAIDRGGRRGHGLAGEGRRSRRRQGEAMSDANNSRPSAGKKRSRRR